MHTSRSLKTIEDYVKIFEMATFLNDALLRQLRLFRFPIHSNIYIAQDEQHLLYFLVEGQVQCTHYYANGKLGVMALSDPFMAIGDIEVLSGERVYSNVIATRDTVMLGIPRSDILAFGADDPRFLRFLIDQLRGKLYTANTYQLNQVLPVIERLALFIHAQIQSGNDAVILPANKEEFASLLGTTPRHLNRVLKELVDSGVIDVGYPRIRILNKSALEAIVHKTGGH